MSPPSAELERLAAACIFPSFPGYEAPDWALRRIEAGIGGICLFAYNVRDLEQLSELTASLRAARPELLIGIDEEGGDVTRLEVDRGSSYPGNGALGTVDDEELTEQIAAAIGADLAAVGVNLDFAPVADVNVNPSNPVIGIRSFGTELRARRAPRRSLRPRAPEPGSRGVRQALSRATARPSRTPTSSCRS